LAFSPPRGGLRKNAKYGTDRARRVLLGTIVGAIGASDPANRERKYSNPVLRYLTSLR